ncbi:MAG: N-acetylmuramidase family protein [Bacteroides sp.]|nr:N-acetylmuramidase family protein [Bacteroides sp.]
MKPLLIFAGACIGLAGCSGRAQTPPGSTDNIPSLPQVVDTTAVAAPSVTIAPPPDPVEPARLTDHDYTEVAKELGIEVAAMKAIVEIEAGREHKGFMAPGKPIINFDLTMFRRFASKNGVKLEGQLAKHPEVFSQPNTRRYGSYQKAQYARLDGASQIDRKTAIYATFWGLFQIGGFNWKLCGTKDHEDFVTRMSTSEREQLELFAEFIKECGYLKHLKDKNWEAFARCYNGPGYAKKGYHTKMAAAYARYKRDKNTIPDV